MPSADPSAAAPSSAWLRVVEAFARWLVHPKVAVAVVIGTVVLAVGAGAFALRVEHDDDVLAFLPASNPDIQAFHAINERFGSTDVALVGVEVDDPFDPVFLTRLQELTRTLRDTPGLDSVLTLTNMTDFRSDLEGGVIVEDLVPSIPAGPAERDRLRDAIMARDHVVGTLVSEDERAVLVYAFAAPGAQPREVAGAVRAAVQRSLPDHAVYWGGGPFLSTWIYETTQADMARLTPWSVLAIVVVLLLAFRDLPGTLLGLFATTVGIAVSRAAMALLGIPFNVVLSAMPVILFATGSAYAIHMLSDHNRQAHVVGPGREAVVRTVVETAPGNLIAGMTTMAGMGSLVWMDIEPLRVFGMFTALGVTVAMIVSLTFVPAVLSLWPRPYHPRVGSWLEPAVAWLASNVRQFRGVVAAAAVALGLAGAYAASTVRTQMDLGAFFSDDSEPAVAQRFLEERFGGSQFLQILVEGDLEEPAVLRELGRLGDRVATLPGVSDVRGVEHALRLVGDSMVGARRIPDTRGQVATLYRFLENDPGASRLVTPDRRSALLQVTLADADADAVDAVLARVEALVASEVPRRYAVVPRAQAPSAADARFADQLVARVAALARRHRVHLPAGAEAAVRGLLRRAALPPEPSDLQAGARRMLEVDASFVELTPETSATLAGALARSPWPTDAPGLRARLAEVLPEPERAEELDMLTSVLEQPWADLRRTEVARATARALVDEAGLTLPLGGHGQRFLDGLTAALQDRDAPDVLLPDDGAQAAALSWTVNGMPVLYRGLSQSVAANQTRSFLAALVTVVLLMTAVYRSVWTGLLMAVPTGMTLLFVYGLMGLRGVHLDIGTSLIASMILGDSVDYAVHTLHGWQASPDEPVDAAVERGVRHAAHSVWTNAFMVSAGFLVLALGEARPLQNVGLLVAVAMLMAALTTFVFLPLLGRERRYRRASPYDV